MLAVSLHFLMLSLKRSRLEETDCTNRETPPPSEESEGNCTLLQELVPRTVLLSWHCDVSGRLLEEATKMIREQENLP